MNIHEWSGSEIPPTIVNQAADWIALLDGFGNNTSALSENLSKLEAQQQNDFYTWLGANPLNQQAFVELSELWAKTACLQSFKAMITQSHVISFPAKQPIMQQPLLADPIDCSKAFAPSWLYSVTLMVICTGFFIPVIT